MLPWLLRAIKQGEPTVRLDDGTLGIISQAGLLDALFASELEAATGLTIAGYEWRARRIAAVSQEAVIQS